MKHRPTRKAQRTNHGAAASPSSEALMQKGDLLDPFTVGSWTPCADLCETESRVLIRVELPGVELSDVKVSLQGEAVRIEGVKRSPERLDKLLCYYCLERRYGRFDRRLRLGTLVNARMAAASLENGILTIELPRVEERRGGVISIPIGPRPER